MLRAGVQVAAHRADALFRPTGHDVSLERSEGNVVIAAEKLRRLVSRASAVEADADEEVERALDRRGVAAGFGAQRIEPLQPFAIALRRDESGKPRVAARHHTSQRRLRPAAHPNRRSSARTELHRHPPQRPESALVVDLRFGEQLAYDVERLVGARAPLLHPYAGGLEFFRVLA